MKVKVQDKGLQYVADHGEFESEVHDVQMLSLPDDEAMKKKSILSPKAPQMVPIKLVTLLLVGNPQGRLMWANMEHCTVI